MSHRRGKVLLNSELEQIANALAESDDESVCDDDIADPSYQLDKNANREASDSDELTEINQEIGKSLPFITFLNGVFSFI